MKTSSEQFGTGIRRTAPGPNCFSVERFWFYKDTFSCKLRI